MPYPYRSIVSRIIVSAFLLFFTLLVEAGNRVVACQDTDGDGICDSEDPCPLDNPDDTDSDGVCDTDDLCIGNDATGDGDLDGYCFDLDCNDSNGSVNPGAIDVYGDGIDTNCDAVDGDPSDRDGDGVDNDGDNCPDHYNPSQTDSSGDGIGNVCDPDNVCSGTNPPIVEDTTYDGSVYCAAESSITAGGLEPSPGAVIVSPSGNVVYSAPIIELVPQFSVEPNGIFRAGPDLVSPVLCSETCASSGDGDCDDGGPGFDYDICPLGTDCKDCGPR